MFPATHQRFEPREVATVPPPPITVAEMRRRYRVQDIDKHRFPVTSEDRLYMLYLASPVMLRGDSSASAGGAATSLQGNVDEGEEGLVVSNEYDFEGFHPTHEGIEAGQISVTEHSMADHDESTLSVTAHLKRYL